MERVASPREQGISDMLDDGVRGSVWQGSLEHAR